MHSSSTVTDSGGSASNSPSNSPCSSRDGSDTDLLSPRSSPPPRGAWPSDEFDEDYDLASPFSRKAVSVASRALPRCAVVNFSRDGDNLRWAPRATQNASGVAARVHNFEDAFSLEEFSSRALPVVWHAHGGNPRLSSALREEQMNHANKDNSTPRTKSSLSASQKSMVKSPSVKRTMVLAQEIRRPSFWSLLAHNNRIQKSRAQRLADQEIEQEKKAAQAKKSPWSARIKAVMMRGTQDKSAHGKKGGSVFRRFVERRSAKVEPKKVVVEQKKVVVEQKKRTIERDLSKAGIDREEKPGSIRLRKRAGVGRMSADMSKLGDNSRRVRSSLTGTSKKKAEGNATTTTTTTGTSQDDQYVTFMTSAVC